jgi:CheY-like chemotaxis protein
VSNPGVSATLSSPFKNRVLIIEDNRDTADSLQILLQLLDYDTAVAYTGPAGVAKAVAWHPAVVVCDIGLPELDGYGVAMALRHNAATANACLIAVTGYGQDEDRRRALQAGFNFHLVKPVDPEALCTLLSRCQCLKTNNRKSDE